MVEYRICGASLLLGILLFYQGLIRRCIINLA